MCSGTTTGRAAGILLALLATTVAYGQSAPDPANATRLIIKLRDAAPIPTADTAPTGTAAADDRRQAQGRAQMQEQEQEQERRNRLDTVSGRAGLEWRSSRTIGAGMAALTLARRLSGAELDRQLAALRSDPDIEFAVVDQRRFAQAMPSDPLYPNQWYLQNGQPAAANFAGAWDITTGSPDTVIAVVDTGVRYDHPDLTSRLLPGHDFISGDSPTSFVTANDGNGWDADASDPGDWVTSAEKQSGPLSGVEGCDVGNSTWHGTRVAALIGAGTNNGMGIAGGTWQGGILPVRVLGKCGGFDSDIIAGMLWAAGLPVTGAPPNPHPARVINLSLGSSGTCTAAYQSAIGRLTAAGTLVVASAGNDNEPVGAPANCSGVLAVAGLRHAGTKVGYSDFGPEISVAAPAGNCPDLDTTSQCTYSLITADNSGLTAPAASTYTDEFHPNIGTSFSAPIVTAIAGLMYAVNDKLTTAEWIDRVKAGARSFPAPDPGLPTCPATSTDDATLQQCNCTTTTCGAGIADAEGAVAWALRPIARIASVSGSGAGQNVRLDGSTSAAGRNRTLDQYAWTPVSGDPVFVGATNEPVTTVAVPASGLVTVRLTVTDDVGRSDSRELTLGASSGGGGSGSTSGGGGGGGGGAVDLLVPGLLLALARRRRSMIRSSTGSRAPAG